MRTSRQFVLREAIDKLEKLRIAQNEEGNAGETLEGREEDVYDPKEVLDLARETLKHSLGVYEKYAIVEQAFVASLEVGKGQVAQEMYGKLEKRFPGSLRVQLLGGLLLESEKKWEEATVAYQKILEQDETDMRVHKRLIAVLVASGKRAEAIEALNAYLDTFMQDTEGWLQLAELYLEEGHFKAAAFCIEEVMLLQPLNHLPHIQFADVQYTLKNYRLALKHYCRALDLCRDNVRAHYGILLCCQQLKEAPGNSSKQQKEANLKPEDIEKLTKISTSLIRGAYKQDSPRLLSVIEELLKRS